MTPHEKLRAMVDKLRKHSAAKPPLPSGGPRRTMEEAMGTGAAARNLAQTNTRIGKSEEVAPLPERMRRMRSKVYG